MNRGVFLDRDGVLNALIFYPDTSEFESPRVAADLVLKPDAPSALQHLRGWPLFLISNQPSYAKGKTSLADLEAVHRRLEELLRPHGVTFQGVYYCYHHPNGIVSEFSGLCECRKPAAGSLLRARDMHELDMAHCWMIGDQDTDIQCGQRAGCKTILIEYQPSQAKRGKSQPDWHCADLMQAVEIVTTSASSR
jgi:D-glycero-D-manno-heptose 1,7-bisphosphate phosphatase